MLERKVVVPNAWRRKPAKRSFPLTAATAQNQQRPRHSDVVAEPLSEFDAIPKSDTDANARWRPVRRPASRDIPIDDERPPGPIDDTIVRQILALDWYTLDFSTANQPLFTSDRPCVFTRDPDDDECVVSLPITPERAFFAMAPQSRAKQDLLSMTAGRRLATALNLSVFGQTRRSVYSRDEDDAPARFLRRYIPFTPDE